jgi:TonB family protein
MASIQISGVHKNPRLAALFAICSVCSFAATASAVETPGPAMAPPVGIDSWCDARLPKPDAGRPFIVESICESQPEVSVADLYRRVATGPHVEKRRRNTVIVTRAGATDRWEFEADGDRFTAALHFLADSPSIAGSPGAERVAIYCEPGIGTDCEAIIRQRLSYIPRPLPRLVDFAFEVSLDGPIEDAMACRSPPMCKAPTEIKYPRGMSCANGRIVVHAYTDRAGCVCDVIIQQSSGNLRMDITALDAIRMWKLEEPKPGIAVVPVSFHGKKCD